MARLTIACCFLFVLFATSCQYGSKDQAPVDRVIELQRIIREAGADSSLVYYNELRELHKQWKGRFPDSILAEYHYLIGRHFRTNGNLDSAAIYYQKSIETVSDSIIGEREAVYFERAWDTYRRMGRYGDCFAVIRNYTELLPDSSPPLLKALSNYFSAVTYKSIKEYDSTLYYNEKRIESLRQLQDTSNIATVMVSNAELYFYYLKDRPKAFQILDALIDKKANLSPRYMRQIFGTYGIFLFYEDAFDQSKIYYELGVAEIKKMTESQDRFDKLANAYNNLAEVSIELKDYPSAQLFLDSVRGIGFDKIDKRLQKDYLNYKSRLTYESGKDFDELLTDLTNIYDYQEQLYLDRTQRELAALTTAKEYEQALLQEKQAIEIKNLKLETRFLWSLIVGTLSLVAIWLAYRRRKLRFEKQKLQMQQRLLRTQMNPHYTSNSLHAIKQLVKKDPNLAASYLLRFSRQLRLVLENSMENYVRLEKELDALREYLELQLIRFPDKFTYTIKLHNLEEEDPIFVPPMLIQPFVENCIEHGFKDRLTGGEIRISMKLDKNIIDCEIMDNGLGMKLNESNTKRSASTKLISNFLKKSTGRKVETTSTNEGTRVTFAIPFKESDHD
ncbi:histidine kinase [Aureitalea marina]|uniref:Signal transduction histidine kinase internal region domain-containing protein n=1 Tax=Aureitalea marina TaxID=930804 RepID=A0A2S7KLX4_9FLAO|nr:histidine kinase [Aureitalea marina]PQB03573.1 hypothetical protein BST85_00665 [Aureitalea marina]